MSHRSPSGTSLPADWATTLPRRLAESAFVLDLSPYPLAFLDLDGHVLHLTNDFPAADGTADGTEDQPEGEARPANGGRTIHLWLAEESARRTVDEFLARLASRAATPAAAEEPEFVDAASPVRGGSLLRMYPVQAGGRAVCILVVLLRPDSPIALGPRLAEQERRQRERLAAVFEASREISSSLDRDVILTNIVSRVRELLAVPEAVLFLMLEDGQTLAPVVAGVDEFYDEVMALRLSLGEGIVGWVARSGRAEIVNHAEFDPRSKQVPGTPIEPTSLLCVPLIIKDQVAGVLALSRFGDASFEVSDLELASILAGHCSAAIENARLYDEQRRMLSELRATQDQLVQSAKLNALGEMAGGVAHDFNNVLTAILGRTQLLLGSITDPEARRALAVIEQTALDGAHTVRRIQEFTRVRQDEADEAVDLNEALLQVAELTRSVWDTDAKARGVHIRLTTELHATRGVIGTAAELREVFTNLVLNAVDALPHGGTIRLITEDASGKVQACVVDDGIGMDETTRERIFDPFFTTKLKKGTGLGLSVAYGILRRHKADIEVDSAPAAGTTFRITFAASERDCAAEPPPAPAPALAPLSVLCIDDEEVVLDVIADLLEALGQNVERALGGGEGIRRALQRRPDVVFTDLGMPEVNGWQVARAVKDAYPDIVVALVTGWGMQLDPEPTRALGVDLIVPKPFTIDDVRRVLQEAQETRRRQAA